jgi:hypothetical protein
MVEIQQGPLSPEAAGRLMGFARACKGAARVVALYPAEHPAIGEAMQRLTAAAHAATATGPLSILVLPDNLLLDGRATARPDAAVVEFAGLLHAHMVGEFTIHPEVEPAAWRTLLALLGRDPTDLRARGGLARALTTAGGIGIEITELDYSGLVKERESGSDAAWDTIITHCLQKDALDLDDETLRLLSEIASDPARLAEFFERTEESRGSTHTTREKAEALLRALRGVSGYYGREYSERLDQIFGNMAAAVSHLSPDFVTELIRLGKVEGSEDASLVAEITGRVTDATVGEFVARAVERERACTARLAEAFRALAPEPARQEAAVSLARKELERLPMGEETSFGRLWGEVEKILLSYSDKDWVSDSYNRELTNAQERAGDAEHVFDDPPERVVGWLTTVSDTAIRSMDLQLLGDLLVVETDAEKRVELLRLVASQVDDLVVLGDFEGAFRLVESMIDLGDDAPSPDVRQQVLGVLNGIVAGDFMTQVATHLNGVKDDEFEHVKSLCGALGPGLVPKLAEVLATESRARARTRLTDLLISFGEHGRQSVAQLRESPNPSVRRTAVQLLRSFGGPEALPDLERLVSDPETSVQREAARALIGFGFDESFQLLKKILVSDKHAGRSSLIEELGSSRDQKAKPLFCHLVRKMECKGRLREVYLRSLGRLGVLGGPEAIAALSEVLLRGQWWAPFRTREIRTEAATALAQIKSPEARDAMRNAATNGSFGVRAIARRFVR